MKLSEICNVDKLKACADELKKLGPDTEREFLNIGTTLNRLADTCFKMTDDCLKLVSVSNFNSNGAGGDHQTFIEETRSIFGDVTRQVGNTVGSLGDCGQLLQQLSSSIRKLKEPIQVLYSIGKTFKVLGISIKVESSRAETSSHGFKLLADEVADIAMLVQDNCRFCLEKSGEVERGLGFSYQTLSSAAQADDRYETGIYSILETLEEIGSKSESLSIGIQERSGEMSQGIGEVVMAMQFHDITRQQLENVSRSLLDVIPKIETCRNDSEIGSSGSGDRDVLEIYMVLSIQAAHLNSIYEQVVQARRQIASGLNRSKDQAKLQAGDARELLEIEGHAGSRNIVQSLEKEIDNIVNSLNKALAVVHEAASISREVYDNVSEIGDFVGKIEKIAFDVKILALNAMAESSKTGVTGMTLIVLAKELSVLSQETLTGAAQGIEMLRGIIDGTRKQLEFTTRLNQSRSDVDAMIHRARELTETILTSMQQIGRVARAMDDRSRDLASRIMKLLPGIKFPEVMGERIDRNWGLICRMLDQIEERYPTLLENNDEVRQMVEDLSKQYVMARERSVHAQVAGIGVVEDIGSEDVDLFGDEDVELFGSDEEEQLADNVELF